MSRPLVISDCDEVLLHMVAPFRDWLGEARGVDFHMGTNDFSQALRWQESGGRTRTEPDLSEWLGKRAAMGKRPPYGFPKDYKFN